MQKNKSKVMIINVNDYIPEEIYEGLKWAVEGLGGLDTILGQIKKDASILMKPNLVRKASVERAVITHPVVMEQVARLFNESGYENLSAGDSCGYESALKVMEGTGMPEKLAAQNVKVKDFSSGTKTNIHGHRADHMVMCDEVLNCDAYINVCKMKTHALERITGAVKNIYGTVFSLHKAKGHTRFPDAYSFAGMLIDLNKFVKPKLHIMDGIMAMEGNGPTSGDPRHMGLMLVSTDPVALDTVYCHLIHLNPKLVPTNVIGEQQDLGNMNTDNIEVWTKDGEVSMEEAVKLYGCADFNVDRNKHKEVAGWIKMVGIFRFLQKKPKIEEDKCIKCGICVESCPVEGKAISFKNGRKQPPVYDYKKCVRCFCCQEMCPNKAIVVKKRK